MPLHFYLRVLYKNNQQKCNFLSFNSIFKESNLTTNNNFILCHLKNCNLRINKQNVSAYNVNFCL